MVETPPHPDPLPARGERGWRAQAVVAYARPWRRPSCDAVDDCRARSADGCDRVPVGPVRHGRRADPDRRAVGADAAADRDGAARDHADGLERLARLPVAGAYPLAAGVGLPDRLRVGARAVVADALRARQAGRAADARRHAVHGADAAQGHQANPDSVWQGAL